VKLTGCSQFDGMKTQQSHLHHKFSFVSDATPDRCTVSVTTIVAVVEFRLVTVFVWPSDVVCRTDIGRRSFPYWLVSDGQPPGQSVASREIAGLY
jgi:hypothetical protein